MCPLRAGWPVGLPLQRSHDVERAAWPSFLPLLSLHAAFLGALPEKTDMLCDCSLQGFLASTPECTSTGAPGAAGLH